MITVSKDGNKQVLSFGDEYWYREWREDANEVFKRLSEQTPAGPIGTTGETWWKDWEKITPGEYFAYIQLFTKK